MSSSSKKTFADVQAAFETQRVLQCSRRELEHLLVAAGAETIADPVQRARAREMNETLRSLLAAKTPRRRSRLAMVAALLALAALLVSGGQAYYWRALHTATVESTAELGDYIRAATRDELLGDPRIQLTIDEMARRAPTLRTGSVQAWWAGEQARQVQSLEAQAKRQVIVGDRDGAVRSVQRADEIRSGIDSLASFERPPEP